MATELEMMFKVWNSDGWHYEVGPDNDGLGCIEIRYFEDDETVPRQQHSYCKEDARLLAEAIFKLTED